MTTEKGLYAQVVVIYRKDLDNYKKDNPKRYNLQGQSARSKLWIYLIHEWLEENFSTHEPEFYKKVIK